MMQIMFSAGEDVVLAFYLYPTMFSADFDQCCSGHLTNSTRYKAWKTTFPVTYLIYIF